MDQGASPRGDRLRLFLACWVLFSVHFATNVVREHYPAFAFVEHGNFQLDDYAGFHSDIFEHSDGHFYIGNQVTGSLPAILPLLVLDPVLEALEERGRRSADRASDTSASEYDTEYPLRSAFYSKVRKKGLHLRFGAATAVTSVLLMAPLSALFVVLLFGLLLGRGVTRKRALALSLIFAFGTPLFYRTATLNHNLFLMMAVFASFCMVWNRGGTRGFPPRGRLLWGGFFSGVGLALDYAGVVPLLVIYGWMLLFRAKEEGFATAFRESLAFVLGAVPPVLWLLASQWWMYGHPFLPGQYWMPEVNFTDRGWRGFSWPSPDLFFSNLFSRNYGLLAFSPILALALVPASRSREGSPVVSRRVKWFVWTFVILFLVFNAANQYSRMQWNTGFRYLLPLVPFLFLLVCDHLARCRGWVLVALAVPSVLHMWVLCMFRFTPVDSNDSRTAIGESWSRFFDEGIQLPWLTVIRQTIGEGFVNSPLAPYVVLVVAAALVAGAWCMKGRRSSP